MTLDTVQDRACRSTCGSVGPALQRLAAAMAAEPQPDRSFEAFEEAVRHLASPDFFSISLRLPGTSRLRRIFTTDGFAAVGEDKDFAGREWGRVVLDEGRTFAGDRAAILACFPDGEKVAALGFLSFLNVPVVWAGATIGTVNLFSRRDAAFPQAVADDLARLAPTLVAPLLLARRIAGLARR